MKKIKVFIVTTLLIFSMSFNSFASPLVAIPITESAFYLLAMVGVTFGLTLPQSDIDWDIYSNSLRKHLRVVDDEYIKELDEIAKQNNIKPGGNNNGDKIQIPISSGLIDFLDELFSNVGNDVKQHTERSQLVGGNLNIASNIGNTAIKNGTLDTYLYNIKDGNVSYLITLDNGEIMNLKYEFVSESSTRFIYKATVKVGDYIKEYTYDYSSRWHNLQNARYVGVGALPGGNLCMMDKAQGYSYILKPDNINSYFVKTSNFSEKSNLKYESASPQPNTEGKYEINKQPLEIPGNLPGFDIDRTPSPEPEPDPSPEPEPDPSPEPEPDPSPEPEPDPSPDEGNGSLPSFPSFGDELDFSPLYITNIKEKFPFSLPWDLGRIFNKFDVEPIAPRFEFPILGEKLVIDFTTFDEWANIGRFFVLIGFVTSLIFVSTKLKS